MTKYAEIRPYSEDYVWITIHDELPPPDARVSLSVNFPNMLKFSVVNSKTKYDLDILATEAIERKTAAELFIERFVRKAAASYALSEEGIYYVTHFYSYAVVGLTIHVIRENMPSIDEKLPEQIERTFYGSVDDVIRSYIQFSQGNGAI